MSKLARPYAMCFMGMLLGFMLFTEPETRAQRGK